ncbi:protein kinase, partial [Myxococcota bacterium]|nr:protein kinase [Myxococcota bacterium]
MVDERWERYQIGGYRLQQQAAKDRLGTLYEAVHEDTTYPAWIKIFHTPHTRSHELQTRYREGIAYLIQFRHQHVAQVYHADHDPQTGLYVILEHASGHPLDRVLEQKVIPPPLRPLPLFLEMLDGLHKLHQSSIIHGDLRLANIILGPSETTQRDQLQILHFGQNWWWDDRLRKAGGYAPESAFYTPPEQMNGDGLLDHRIDIFAAGVVLAEMLMRRRLFDGSLARLRDAQKDFFAQVCTDLEKERKLSLDLEDVLRYALAERPNHRYASAQEFADALRERFANVLGEGDDEEGEATGRFSGFDDPLGLEPSEATVVHRNANQDYDVEDYDTGPQTQRIDLEAEGLMVAMDNFGQRKAAPYGSPSGAYGNAGIASGGYQSSAHLPTAPPPAHTNIPASALTGGRDPLDVTLVGQKKGKPQGTGPHKGLIFGAVVVVLLLVGAGIFVFLPPTPTKDPRVDPDKQIFVKLQLHSVPAGAEIWLGGEKQENTTPAELSVRIGRKVQIQIRKDGFLPHLYSWTATSDTYQNVPLQPLPRPIASNPPQQGNSTNNPPNTNTPSNTANQST